jgi:hypothetical protein
MALLLTQPQIDAINARARIRSVFQIGTPTSAVSTIISYRTIHTDFGADRRVTDPGEREWKAAGFSHQSKEPLETVTQDIEVSNADGLFYPSTAGNFFYNSVGAWQAPARSCYLFHALLVELAGAWSLLPCMYVGKIVDVSYIDARRADGTLLPYLAVIKTEAAGAADIIRKEWDETDGDDVATGLTFVPHY